MNSFFLLFQPAKCPAVSKVSEESKENWNSTTLSLYSSILNAESRCSSLFNVNDFKSLIPSVPLLSNLMPPASVGTNSDFSYVLDDEGNKNIGK